MRTLPPDGVTAIPAAAEPVRTPPLTVVVVRLDMVITDKVLDPELPTYAVFPSGEKATPQGAVPTVIVPIRLGTG